jgi:ubiquinone/menaquinone biosynthesis C-methylase UbiE
VTAQPHFVRDYRRVVANFLKTYPLDIAMDQAVGGGGYEANGRLECETLIEHGLRPGHFVVDIGCGSGRLSTQLSQRFGHGIEYLGIDVVPELIAYARSKAAPTYRFHVTEGLSIPAPDNSVDYIAAFSVFTHLKHRETKSYLRDAHRVMQPGAKLVFSFLELPRHRREFIRTIGATVLGVRKVQNHFISRSAIKRWARKIGFAVETIGPNPLGQTVTVLRKI